MRGRLLAYVLFGIGVFLLFVHTTLPALWQILGIPSAYRLASSDGLLAISTGFTPPLGAMLMLVAGLVYGSAESERR